MDTNAEDGGAPENFAESLIGLAIFFLAPLTGAIASILMYRWTGPDDLTLVWALGYIGFFLVTTWISSALAYALRRLLLAAAIAGGTFGLGYIVWNPWVA